MKRWSSESRFFFSCEGSTNFLIKEAIAAMMIKSIIVAKKIIKKYELFIRNTGDRQINDISELRYRIHFHIVAFVLFSLTFESISKPHYS